MGLRSILGPFTDENVVADAMDSLRAAGYNSFAFIRDRGGTSFWHKRRTEQIGTGGTTHARSSSNRSGH